MKKNIKYKSISQFEPSFGKEERVALNKYMKEGGWVTEFKKTRELESMIRNYTGSKYCFLVNNGSVSLLVAGLACGIGNGDEIIVPNFTMIATPNAFRLLGAKIVLVDVEEKTLCLDYNKVVSSITKKTKAIVLVSANGRYPSYDISKLRNLCKKKKIFLIEDSAQSLGSFYPNGSHMGTEGDIGSFSFSPAKIISTGQGGAIVTNSSKLAKKIMLLKDFGRRSGGNDVHDFFGFNFKFTDIQAVIGIEQMKKIRVRISKKKMIFRKYKQFLMCNKNIQILDNPLKDTAPWFVEIIAKNRTNLVKYLKNFNINTRLMYPSINSQKIYKCRGDFPISEMIAKEGLWLPSSIDLKKTDIKNICERINDFYYKQ